MECKLIRNNMGVWCGYISFETDTKTLLMYKLIDNDILEDLSDRIHCHGGITYRHIKDNIVVLGFDCCHSGDFSPILINSPYLCFLHSYEKYRTRHYATRQCKSIVFQLEELFSTIK